MRKIKIIFTVSMLAVMIAFGLYLRGSHKVAPLTDGDWIKIGVIYTVGVLSTLIVNSMKKV